MLRLQPETPEMRIRALLDAEPGLSVSQVSKRAQVSLATASKWAEVMRAEEGTPRQQLAQ